MIVYDSLNTRKSIIIILQSINGNNTFSALSYLKYNNIYLIVTHITNNLIYLIVKHLAHKYCRCIIVWHFFANGAEIWRQYLLKQYT